MADVQSANLWRQSPVVSRPALRAVQTFRSERLRFSPGARRMPDDPRMPARATAPGPLSRRSAMAGTAITALSAFLGSGAAASGLLRIGGTGMALATIHQIGDAFTATRP